MRVAQNNVSFSMFITKTVVTVQVGAKLAFTQVNGVFGGVERCFWGSRDSKRGFLGFFLGPKCSPFSHYVLHFRSLKVFDESRPEYCTFLYVHHQNGGYGAIWHKIGIYIDKRCFWGSRSRAQKGSFSPFLHYVLNEGRPNAVFYSNYCVVYMDE